MGIPVAKTHLPPIAMEKQEMGVDATEEFSVWGLPPDGVRDRIKTLMSALRADFLGTPAFEPHITLVHALRLPPVDALRRIRSAAASLPPFTAKVSVISRVHLLIDPSPEVMQAGAHCRSHFGYQMSRPYIPHMSLLAGDMTDGEKERVGHRAAAIDKEICDLSFEVSRIALCKTDTKDKSLESWALVEVCELKKH